MLYICCRDGDKKHNGDVYCTIVVVYALNCTCTSTVCFDLSRFDVCSCYSTVSVQHLYLYKYSFVKHSIVSLFIILDLKLKSRCTATPRRRFYLVFMCCITDSTPISWNVRWFGTGYLRGRRDGCLRSFACSERYLFIYWQSLFWLV